MHHLTVLHLPLTDKLVSHNSVNPCSAVNEPQACGFRRLAETEGCFQVLGCTVLLNESDLFGQRKS